MDISEESEYLLEWVFNCDGKGLFWKKIPSCTYQHKNQHLGGYTFKCWAFRSLHVASLLMAVHEKAKLVASDTAKLGVGWDWHAMTPQHWLAIVFSCAYLVGSTMQEFQIVSFFKYPKTKDIKLQINKMGNIYLYKEQPPHLFTVTRT